MKFFSNIINRYALAKHCPRALRSLAYKNLYKKFKSEYSLPPEAFDGKKILVVGSANTALEDLHNIDISNIDIVVKMNNGIHTSFNFWNEESLRCDVLFHSLGDGTQPITLNNINCSGVKWLVHRTLKRSSFLDTLLTDLEFKDAVKVKIIPYERYNYLSEKLGGYAPSTGMVCADFFLNTRFSSLTFVGFTFFSTRYLPGYDDKISSDEEAFSKVRDAGHHSPSHEARLIHKITEEAKAEGKNIYISKSMHQAMSAFKAL